MRTPTIHNTQYTVLHTIQYKTIHTYSTGTEQNPASTVALSVQTPQQIKYFRCPSPPSEPIDGLGHGLPGLRWGRTNDRQHRRRPRLREEHIARRALGQHKGQGVFWSKPHVIAHGRSLVAPRRREDVQVAGSERPGAASHEDLHDQGHDTGLKGVHRRRRRRAPPPRTTSNGRSTSRRRRHRAHVSERRVALTADVAMQRACPRGHPCRCRSPSGRSVQPCHWDHSRSRACTSGAPRGRPAQHPRRRRRGRQSRSSH